MANHPNRKKLNYEPGFTFKVGEKFRERTIIKVAKFYPIRTTPEGPRPCTTISAISGFQKMADRPAYDTGRHILLMRSGRWYRVEAAQHQFRSLDKNFPRNLIYVSRADAEAKFEALVRQYETDPKWITA